LLQHYITAYIRNLNNLGLCISQFLVMTLLVSISATYVRAAFTWADPKSVKIMSSCQYLFAILWSEWLKAMRKLLMNGPLVTKSNCSFQTPYQSPSSFCQGIVFKFEIHLVGCATKFIKLFRKRVSLTFGNPATYN